MMHPIDITDTEVTTLLQSEVVESNTTDSSLDDARSLEERSVSDSTESDDRERQTLLSPGKKPTNKFIDFLNKAFSRRQPEDQKEAGDPKDDDDEKVKVLEKEIRLKGYEIGRLNKIIKQQEQHITDLEQSLSKVQLNRHSLTDTNAALKKQLQTVIEKHEAFVKIHGELSGGSADQFLQMSAVLDETRAQLRQALGDVDLQSRKELQQQLKDQQEAFQQETTKLESQRVSDVHAMKVSCEQDKKSSLRILNEAYKRQADELGAYKQQYEEMMQEKLTAFQERDDQIQINRQNQQEINDLKQEVKKLEDLNCAAEQKLWRKDGELTASASAIRDFKEESNKLFKKQMTKGLFLLGAIVAVLGNVVTLIAAGISYWAQKRALKMEVKSMGIEGEGVSADKTVADLELVTFYPGSFFKFCASFGNKGYLPEYKMQLKRTPTYRST